MGCNILAIDDSDCADTSKNNVLDHLARESRERVDSDVRMPES